MREKVKLISAMLVLFSIFASFSPASAWDYAGGASNDYGIAHRGVSHYSYRGGGSSIPGPCWVAARQGGPCGCTAESAIFGTTVPVLHGLNLWLADTWRTAFRHVAPELANAVVWPHRHVEHLLSARGGQMVTSGPYGVRTLRITPGLVFVRAEF